ncbi:MAG: XRE family transcriptional regulator [Pseudomonadota bacterium]
MVPRMDQWVRKALQHSGMKQAELARRMTDLLGRSIDRAAVNKMTIPGGRNLAADEMIAIGKITDFPLPNLRAEMFPTAILVGYVGSGAEMTLFAEARDDLERVRTTDGHTENTVAVEVRGKSLGDVFDRWLIYYEQTKLSPTPDLLNQLCVCGLADGRILIKKLMHGSIENYYTLLSNFEPPIYDVALDWATRVKMMRPR